MKYLLSSGLLLFLFFSCSKRPNLRTASGTNHITYLSNNQFAMNAAAQLEQDTNKTYFIQLASMCLLHDITEKVDQLNKWKNNCTTSDHRFNQIHVNRFQLTEPSSPGSVIPLSTFIERIELQYHSNETIVKLGHCDPFQFSSILGYSYLDFSLTDADLTPYILTEKEATSSGWFIAIRFKKIPENIRYFDYILDIGFIYGASYSACTE